MKTYAINLCTDTKNTDRYDKVAVNKFPMLIRCEDLDTLKDIYENGMPKVSNTGYKVIDNLGFASVEEGVDAALKANADIVVICSSDDEYAEYAIPAYKYLDGRAMFVVAGAPACVEELKAAGIENFIHVRCDVLETLKEYNAKLGIK